MSYVHPEYLVDTEWLAAHLDDPDVRIIESDEDPLLYSIGHIPGGRKGQAAASSDSPRVARQPSSTR